MRNDLTYTQAGYLLRLSLNQVRDRAMKGQLEARRDEQGRYRITRESVERFRREQQRETAGSEA